MAGSSPPDHHPIDLELTVISAKHLKNVNWRNGPLKPYVSFFLDSNPNPNPNPNPNTIPNPNQRLSTRSDDSESSRPVWNERFLLPITRSLLRDSFLTFEIFHSKPSETPKPLVGAARFSLSNLLDSPELTQPIALLHSLDVLRPSGRPQGKLRVKFVLRERPFSPPPYYAFAPEDFNNYHPAPPSSPSPSPPVSVPVPVPSPYGYSGYCYGYYAPPPPARHSFNRLSSSYLPPMPRGPSAPVEFSSENNTGTKPTIPPPSPSFSSYTSMYGPSAPVDYTYPSYDYKPIPPQPRWINNNASALVDSDQHSHLQTVIPAPRRWVSSNHASAPVGYVPSYDRGASSGPTAPEDLAPKEEEEETVVRRRGGGETVESVVDAMGGMSLEQGNYARRERERYGGYDDYRHGY